ASSRTAVDAALPGGPGCRHHRPVLPPRLWRNARLTRARPTPRQPRRGAATGRAAPTVVSGAARPLVQQAPGERGRYAEVRPAELWNDGRIDRHHPSLQVQHGTTAASAGRLGVV